MQEAVSNVMTVQCDQCYNKNIGNYVLEVYPHLTEMVM